MELKRSLLILTTLTMVSQCTLFPTRTLEVSAKPIQRQISQPVLPREIDLKEPYWYVVSDENLEEFLERVKKENPNSGDLVFFAMSVPDYELMAYNMQELKRYITELKSIVVYYRTVTTEDIEYVKQ